MKITKNIEILKLFKFTLDSLHESGVKYKNFILNFYIIEFSLQRKDYSSFPNHRHLGIQIDIEYNSKSLSGLEISLFLLFFRIGLRIA